MDNIHQLGKKRFASQSGVTGLPPEQGAKRFFFVLTTHFRKLLCLNLLFVAFCIPIVTIPAAFCGMNRVLIKLVRDGNCFLWSDFIKEFKQSFFKSMPFGVLCVVLTFSGLQALSMGFPGGGEVNALFAALAFLLLAFMVLFSGYAFVFLSCFNLKGRHIAKNALLFTLSQWKANFALLGLAIPTIVLVFDIYYSLARAGYSNLAVVLVLLLVIYFALVQLAVCVTINRPMQKRIIDPYEESKKDGEA